METIIIDDVTLTPFQTRKFRSIWYEEGDMFSVYEWNDFCWQDVKTGRLIFKAHAHIITEQPPNTYRKEEILETINSISTRRDIGNAMEIYGYTIMDAEEFKAELIKRLKLEI